VAIRIAGDFFLWNMCRRLAGLLVMVGLGQCSAEDVARDAAACLVQTLPPKGLELQEVWYAPDGCGLDPNSPA
jgi:tRNA U38,U39,U40 pseudouridine synthase TruA